MTRDFEVEGEQLVIRTDGRVKAVPLPKDVSSKLYRHVIAAVDVLYRRNGAVPTPAEVCKEWEDFDKKTVQLIYTLDEFKQALSVRGIEMSATRGLTEEQLTAITLLSNPTDGRSTAVKLRDVGIPVARHRAWMRNALYAKHLREQSESNLGDAIPTVLNKLIANAEGGDQRAIDKVLEMTGRWNPQQQEIQNARTVVLSVLEAVQKHVDPATLKKILGEVQGKVQVLSITNSLKELD